MECSVGYLLNWFEPDCPWQVYTLMNAIGWSMIVTAESLVLYSRYDATTPCRAQRHELRLTLAQPFR